jgi:hypothetical protein
MSTTTTTTEDNNNNKKEVIKQEFKKGERATNRVKENISVVLKKEGEGEEVKNETAAAPISKDELLKGIKQSANAGKEIEEAQRQKQTELENRTSAPASAYTGGNPSSPSSFWTPKSVKSEVYTLHQQHQQQPNNNTSGILAKGSFDSILLQEQKQQQEQQKQEQQQQQDIKFFFGMPPQVTQEMLDRISKSLEPPSGYEDVADLMQNHQVRCPFPPCNGREIGYVRSQCRDHIEGHEQMREYRNRVRETNKIWFENATKLYRLKEQMKGLQHQIQQVKDTLSMMSSAEDTGYIVQALRAEQFSAALNENRLPASIRNDFLDLGDAPRNDNERQFYESYLAENPDLKEKGVGFSDALMHLLARRKAAKFA